uniref:Uncharacterized protein n=1 Tax=Arundo donax TaxID=35708 RepID=A0A0A9FQG3_ARUDO
MDGYMNMRASLSVHPIRHISFCLDSRVQSA